MVPLIPMVPCKVLVVGFGGALAGLPVWVAKKRRIKKQRDGQALALGGHQSMTITNNQQIVGGSGRGYVWVEARGWESVWGATVPSFGAAIKNRRLQWSEEWRGGATSRRRVIPLFGHA